jgi:hypothetical protein
MRNPGKKTDTVSPGNNGDDTLNVIVICTGCPPNCGSKLMKELGNKATASTLEIGRSKILPK